MTTYKSAASQTRDLEPVIRGLVAAVAASMELLPANEMGRALKLRDGFAEAVYPCDMPDMVLGNYEHQKQMIDEVTDVGDRGRLCELLARFDTADSARFALELGLPSARVWIASCIALRAWGALSFFLSAQHLLRICARGPWEREDSNLWGERFVYAQRASDEVTALAALLA